MEGDQQEQIPQNNQEAGTANENQPIPSDAAGGSGANQHVPQPNPPAQQMKSLKSLPYGFHFRPKDWELIIHYLNRKIRGEPLPLRNFIQHAKLYKSDPEELTKTHKAYATKWHFFTPRPKSEAEHGKWKAVKEEKEIIDKDGQLIGYKRPLEYIHKGMKTGWLMTEYRALNTQQPVDSPSNSMLLDIVLCRVYRSPRAGGSWSNPKPLPPGFHFRPKDRELILHNLNYKIQGNQLPPWNIVQDAELYKCDPEELTRAHQAHATEWNFFTPRPEHGTGHGERKVAEEEKKITDKDGHLIRYKRPLEDFCKGNPDDTSIANLDLPLPSVGRTSGICRGLKKRQLAQAPQPIVPQAACLPHPMKVLRQQSVTGLPGSLQPDHGSHEAEINQEKANDVGSSSLPPSDPRGTE